MRQDSVKRMEGKDLIRADEAGSRDLPGSGRVELDAGLRNRNASYRNTSKVHRNKIILQSYSLGVINSLSVGTMLAITAPECWAQDEKTALVFCGKCLGRIVLKYAEQSRGTRAHFN